MCGMWEKRGSRHPSSPDMFWGPRGPTPLSHLIRHGLSLSHAASWRPIPAHPLPSQEGRCRQKMSTPHGPRFFPELLERKGNDRRPCWQTESTGKYHLYKELGGREGFWALKEKNKARRGWLQLQPGLRCMAGAPLGTCSLCPEQTVRSKCSGSPKPTPSDQSHLTGLSPTSRYRVLRNGADACSFRSLQQSQGARMPWFSHPVRSVCC